jgi:hypothetical protein
MTLSYHHKPAPPVSNRPRCPVCHEAVYSRVDIHPQCAIRRAESPRPAPMPKSPGRRGSAYRSAGAL